MQCNSIKPFQARIFGPNTLFNCGLGTYRDDVAKHKAPNRTPNASERHVYLSFALWHQPLQMAISFRYRPTVLAIAIHHSTSTTSQIAVSLYCSGTVLIILSFPFTLVSRCSFCGGILVNSFRWVNCVEYAFNIGEEVPIKTPKQYIKQMQ
jgi:hypothetical protein